VAAGILMGTVLS